MGLSEEDIHRFPDPMKTLSLRIAAFLFLIANILMATEESQSRPNVLLIVADDLNTRIGPYSGLEYHTPNLDRLAAEGVRFERAYCQYPLCGPSRASFMSGMYPETNGVKGNSDRLGSYRAVTPSLANHPSMAGLFRENGYFSARVSKIYHMGVPGGIERGDPGGDDPDSWDFAYNVMGPETLSQGRLELLSPKSLHYGSNFARMILPDRLDVTQTDYLATSQAVAILENRLGAVPEGASNRVRRKTDAPFFLGVGLVRPHVPLIAPERNFSGIPRQATEVPEDHTDPSVPESALRRKNATIWGMDGEQQRLTIEAYLAAVQFMDEQVGRLLDALERLGARDDTIVIFMSDHGYNLGEHDCWSKISLWEESIRVPLIVSAPGFGPTAGSRSEAVVELIDLYPTLAELCGLEGEVPERVQGRSLVRLLNDPGNDSGSNGAYVVSYDAKDGSLIESDWKYTRWGPKAVPEMEELYHLRTDPGESRNLVRDPEYREQLLRLRSAFDQRRAFAKGS